MNHLKLYSIGALMQHLGLNTGAGKPAVLPKQVTWVWVWFSFLAHHSTLLPVLRYFGYVWVNFNKVILIFTVFFLIFFQCFFFSKFITSHRDGTNMALSAMCTSWQPALLSLPSHFRNSVSHSSIYPN